MAFAGNKVIKIGANLELTGNLATFGNSALNSMRMAVEEINAKGGVMGMKLELVVSDNRSEPAESGNSVTKLITKDKVKFIIGPTTSSTALAAAPIIQNNKAIMLASSATNVEVTKKGDHIFRACFIDDFQGVVAAQFIAKSLKKKKVAILIDNSSDYSVGLAKAFKQTFKGTIVAEEAYLGTDKDFRSQLTKIKMKKPEAIFLPGWYQTVGMIIRQAREFGLNVPVVGGDGWDSPELIKIAGPKALNNTYFTNHYSTESKEPVVVSFVKAYQKKYGTKPDALGALAYDSTYLLADAIKRAGSVNPEKVRVALSATKNFKAVTGTISINKDRNAEKAAVILELKDGKQVFKEMIKP